MTMQCLVATQDRSVNGLGDPVEDGCPDERGLRVGQESAGSPVGPQDFAL